MLNRMILRCLALAGVATAAACGSDNAVSPPANDTSSASLSAALSQTNLGDVSAFTGASAQLGLPSTSAIPTFDPSVCTFTTADKSFRCPARSVGSLSYTLKYFLIGSAGDTLPQFDATHTAAVRAVVDVTGTVSVPTIGNGATAVINHHSDMTLSGLLGGTHTLNGTAHDHDVMNTMSTVPTVTTVDVLSTTTNLVLPADSTRYPASGTIGSMVTTAIEFGQLPSATTEVSTLLTFDGTNFATLAITASAHTTSCRIDLSGKSSPSCS